MSEDSLSRRSMLKRSLVVIGAAAGAGKVLSACGDDSGGGGSFTCTDVSGLDETQRTTRTSLEYVDQTPNPEQTCLNCQLWQSGTNDAECGRCQVVPGPVHPNGWCKSWAAKVS